MMLLFRGMLHHSAPERSLSIPFSGLWFLCLDLRNVSRTRSGSSGEVSSPGCRRDVAGMSPFTGSLAAFRGKKFQTCAFFRFFAKIQYST